MAHDANNEQVMFEALSATGARSVKQVGAAHWRLAFSNGVSFSAAAVAGEDWLVMDVQPSAASKRLPPPARLWDLLEWNGGLRPL